VLEDLRSAREGGARRVDKFEVRQEESVFDVVDEEQYEQLVAKRRMEAGACARRVCVVFLSARTHAFFARFACCARRCCCQKMPPAHPKSKPLF
jgi:hypothetical protein